MNMETEMGIIEVDVVELDEAIRRAKGKIHKYQKEEPNDLFRFYWRGVLEGLELIREGKLEEVQ